MMNKGVWLGGLLLSLGGWLSGVAAQEPTWRPVSPRAAAPDSDTGPEPAPAAELGRPLVVVPALSPQRPLLLPINFELPASPELALPTSAATPAPLPSALHAPELPVIATSAAAPAPGTAPAEDASNEPSEFAQDRRPPTGGRIVSPTRPAAGRGVVAPATWTAPPAGRGPISALTYWAPCNYTAQTIQPVAAAIPQPAADLPPADVAAATQPAPNPATWLPAPAGVNPWTTGGPPTLPAAGDMPGPGTGCQTCKYFYADAEYLLWWLKGERTPPLLTTSSAADFGILRAPTTRVLFGGNSDLNDQARSGARFTVGCMDCGTGFELSGFFAAPRSTDLTVSSMNFPVLGRPFFNVNSNQQFSQLIALPGVSVGNAVINAPSEFWGAEANLRCNLCCSDCYSVGALAGFRYLDLDESLKITENIQGLSTAPPPFTNELITVFDRFATHNQFYGGQIGIDGRYVYGAWSVEGRFKLGLGATEQTINIDGGQRFQGPTGTVAIARGGLLALHSNIGHFSQSRFSVVPEVTLNVGYQLTPHLRTFIGYNFLEWTNVVRPGDQIDTSLNVSRIPNFPTNSPPSNSGHPLVPFRQSDFWAQGLIVGFELTF
jgi:hypothetical protein